MMTGAGRIRLVVKKKASRRIDNKPANYDQKKDLKGPICFAKTPPRKS
jgi:hypothetical protein